MLAMKYYQINENSSLPVLDQFAPFKVVLALEIDCSETRKLSIAEWLVSSGCRYVMVCGEDHESWKAVIRKVNLAFFDIGQHNIENLQSSDFIMVTPHVHEKLRSVFWHAKKVARHPDVKMEQVVTIHIANQNRSVEYLAMYEKA